MKIDEIASANYKDGPAKNRVFTATDRDGTSFAFVIKLVGRDGADRPLWFGSMKQHNGERKEVALVVDDDGRIIAVNDRAPMEAIEKVVSLNRSGYGSSLSPALSWETRRYQGMKLENYK